MAPSDHRVVVDRSAPHPPTASPRPVRRAVLAALVAPWLALPATAATSAAPATAAAAMASAARPPLARAAAQAPAAVRQLACGTAVQASVAGGTLQIVGTDGPDQVRVRYAAAGDTIDVFDPATAATTPLRFAAATVQRIDAALCDGDDVLAFDVSGGAIAGRWATTVDGGGGDDVVLGGVDLSVTSLADALQIVQSLRTAGDAVDAAVALLDAAAGPCDTAPCLVAAAADVVRRAGEDVVLPAARVVRAIEPDLVQPAAAAVRDTHGRLGAFVTTFVSQTAQAVAVDGEAFAAEVESAVDDFALLLPTAQAILTDSHTLYDHVASLGPDVQSRDPVGVFTRTVTSHGAALATLAQQCAEDPEPAETTADEDQQDPSGLAPACAELERRIEALEASTDQVGNDDLPTSSVTRLTAEGDAFEARGDALAAAGEALGDDEAPTSRAATIEAKGEALAGDGDALDDAAPAIEADWEGWVAGREAALGAAGDAVHARGQADVAAAAQALRAGAAGDVGDAAARLRVRAEQLEADLDALFAAAAPLLGGAGDGGAGVVAPDDRRDGAGLADGTATTCTITTTNTQSGGAGSDVLIGTSGNDALDGGDGDDVIAGVGGDDALQGDDGRDVLIGGDGGDELKGGDKVDVLAGGGGGDCLYGGDGETWTKGSLSVDLGGLLLGGDGDDLVAGGDGQTDDPAAVDLAWGGDGVDELKLGHGGELALGSFTFQLGNLAFGQDGEDTITAADGVDVVFGGAGDDTVQTGQGADLDIANNSGTSVLRLALGDLVFGEADDDTIDADDPAADRADDDIDVVFGGGGADTVRGYGGGALSIGDAADPTFELTMGNLVFGEAGEDDITTQDGIDVLFGGDDGDTLQAGQGADLDIAGSGGDSSFRLALGDLAFGDGGEDTLDGDDPAADRADDDIDVLFGGDGADTIHGHGGGLLSIGDAGDPDFELVLGNAVFGGAGADDITTLSGIDVIFGGPDADAVQAGAGDALEIDDDFALDLGDLVFGQDGDDVLHGDVDAKADGDDADGIDVLFGGAGDDEAYGGAGGNLHVPEQDLCLRFGNVLFGGAGDDLLRGDYADWDAASPQGGIDLAFGAAGADTIEGGGGSILVLGDLSSFQVVVLWFGNVLFGGADDDTIRGGDAADLATCSDAAVDAFLNGLGVNDLGGAGDLVFAGGGSDVVDVYDGLDVVFGSPGDDTLRADQGGLVIVPIEGIPTPIHFGNVMFGGMGEDTIRSKGQIWLLVVAQLEVDLLFGGPCDDDIEAGDGFNLVFGNAADDVIRAGDGVNLLFGNRHDDDITAGSGLNVLFGNTGRDAVRGGADSGGVYVLFGNRDRDDVAGGHGLTVAFGNRDDDRVTGGHGLSVLFGNGGHDDVAAGAGLAVAFGNRGRDVVRAGPGLAVLFGNRDDDDVACAAGLCVAFGNDDHDLLGAGAGLNLLFGNAGEDRVTSGTGLGLAFGGGGHDVLASGGGLYLGFGGAADDVIVGGAGLNIAFGNHGRDTLFGGGGTNLLFGNHDADVARGGPGTDFLFGNPGDDTLAGGGGVDFVFGNLGADTLGSHDGADLLFGNRGNDQVRAADGSGCDLLFGNRGDDTLDRCQNCDARFGGRGSDSKTAGCAAVAPPAPSRGEVRGRVWIDLDGDGAGDVGHGGVTVTAGSLSTTTDGDGFYRLVGLAASSSANVAETAPGGYVQVSTPTAHAVAVGALGTDLLTGRDFVNRPRCAVAPDGWGCVAGGCERTPGAAGAAVTCQPMAVRPVLRCGAAGPVATSASDCPCGELVASWEVVTCACLPPPDPGCTLVVDREGTPRCVGSCPDRPGAPCELQRVGDVFRCGCRSGATIHLPVVVVAVAGRITATPTGTPRITTASTTPRPSATATPRATATRRPTETSRPTATPRPTETPRALPPRPTLPPLAAGPSAQSSLVVTGVAQSDVAVDGAWTVLDELMAGGAFFAPLYRYTSAVPVRIDVTDLFVVSDRSEVYVDGQLVGSTPAVADWTAAGGGPHDPPYTADPNAAWPHPAFSKASFVLPAGTHVLTLRNAHRPPQASGAPYPDGTVAFRLVATDGPSATPTTTRPVSPTPTRTPTATPSPTPGCAPRPAGMAAWWTLDELAGATAFDGIGGHHGDVVGGAGVLNPAQVAAGRMFDGGAVRVADAPGLDGGAAGLAVDAWIRPTAVDGQRPIVAKRYAPADAPLGWSFHVVNGRLGFTWSTAGGVVDAVAPMSVTTQAWQLVAASIRPGSPSGGQLYLNGALVHTFDTTALTGPLDTDAQLHIAQQPSLGRGQPVRDFLGAIDEVELFDRPLDAPAVQAIFAAGRLGKCDKPLPVAPSATATPRPDRTPFPPVPLAAAGGR